MGSAESTGRSNGDEKDEGTPDLGAVAVAIGVAAVAAWGVKKMFFDNKGGEVKEEMNEAFKSGANGSSRSSSFASPRRFKMKTDGACHPHGARDIIHSDDRIIHSDDRRVLQGPSGYAGILEDDDGNYVRGFRGFIGVTDCFTAELNGISRGLELLDKFGCMESVLESDSQAAVQWVTRVDKNGPGKSWIVRDCWELIKECRRLIGKNKITVRHCYRNVNKDADKLATIVIIKRDSYVEFTDVYGEIKG